MNKLDCNTLLSSTFVFHVVSSRVTYLHPLLR
jgi:hypothetical protein